MIAAPIAVTCGEPAGIGPEIAVAAWKALRDTIPLFWIGDQRHLPEATPIAPIAEPADAFEAAREGMPVLQHDFPAPVTPGTLHPAQAQSVIDVIARAVDLTWSGRAAGICTAPIHKKVLKDGAGFPWPGHTEFLAHLAGDVDVVMMLASDQLRVVPTTIHVPISQVSRVLTPQLLRRTIEITATGLREQFGIAHPRISVSGLNPHAGEGGAIGSEEVHWIAPLVAEMESAGFAVSGPHSADSLFHAAARALYDAAVTMYHDQALIPIKTLDFDRGVNVTLGLPFIRTSPDHGTALDIAGTGTANPTSMIHAIRMAADMASRRAARAA
jgi:4-hydroxythreonine-4-phosphate dehydrogenase